MNKGETHGTTNKYIWLIEILSQPKTFMQVQELWKKCSLNNNQGQPLDRKTFYNWRQNQNNAGWGRVKLSGRVRTG